MDEKELERRLSLLSDFISETNSKVNHFDDRVKALEEIFKSMKKTMELMMINSKEVLG